MTSTANAEAREAMLSHHRALEDQLNTKVAGLAEAVAAGGKEDTAIGSLVAFLGSDVLTHAQAEERALYPAAAQGELAGTVTEMIAEHRELAAAIERLAAAPDGHTAVGLANGIAALFTSHVAKENDVIVPALARREDVDLAALLRQMHHALEEAAPPAAVGDPLAELLSLLLTAANELARAGQAERACRLAASAWATVHSTRPELAGRVTGALHHLARMGTLTLTSVERAEDGQTTLGGPDLDVRALLPAQRHEAIFAAYRALAPGAGFTLVNDHDPKPLRYQFEAEHAGEFTWDPLESGPEVWRVRIGRPAATADDAEPELDVRILAHGRRHDVIFTAYRALSPGAGFVLVNDHDPRPLRYQFEAQYPDEHTWDYLETGPELWRVRIGRAPASA